MLLSSRRDCQSNAFSDIIPSVGPSLQNMYSSVQPMETDMLMKVRPTYYLCYMHITAHTFTAALCM